ncbi:MAG: histidine kinase [Verrucomicrobiota bacterium]
MVGLMLGVIGVSLLHPLLENSFKFAKDWIEWCFSPGANQPGGILSKISSSVLKGSGTNPFMFAVLAIVWHAIRCSSDLLDWQLKSAELESRLRDAQLQALRSQLNPHFLFNTLHSIAELVHEDPDLAEQLVLRLGDLLRRALESSDQREVPLAEEIEFIKAYLDIEQMHLGDRLRVVWDVAPDVLVVKVPSLILQPLVENAIQHGIAASDQPGELRIRAQLDNGFRHLHVSDSGPGLQQRTEALKAGIGLSNTEARLRTIFGEQHRFELINDNGLSANMRLPISMLTSIEERYPRSKLAVESARQFRLLPITKRISRRPQTQQVLS